MDQAAPFKILTVGNFPVLVRILWDRVAAKGGYSMAHIAHPSYDRASWPTDLGGNPIHFFVDNIKRHADIPPPEDQLLASLEEAPVPTIHNMIMSDRVVATLPYSDALAYATLLARRCFEVYESVKPSVVIGSFDSLHNSIGFAVANRMRIPWVTPLYSPLPGNEVALCSNLSPASRISFDPHRASTLHGKAETLLEQFEQRKLAASAYVPPALFSAGFLLGQVPRQFDSLARVLKRRNLRRYLRFNEPAKLHSLRGMVSEAARLRKNLWQVNRKALRSRPPQRPYVFFGLHMQPESSIDVFAHFFSNQERVVELMSRSIPPTHSLLVKLHKSDVHNYSDDKLDRLSRFPGVELISPFADTLEFIRGAGLIFAIQGTIGLEGALLGKPVIMFGDSPAKVFPSVSTFGKAIDLPELLRRKLHESPPERSAIVAAFARYLAPFYPGVTNDWSVTPPEAQIEDFAKLVGMLRNRENAAHEHLDA